DGGSHFLGEEVRRACEELNIVKITTPAYSPFVNGLIENTNKLLISRLKRKCCPNLDEAEYENVDPESLPGNWPDFFDECIAELNDRILPGTRFTPREVQFGMCLAPIHIPPEIPKQLATDAELDNRMTLAEVLRMESFARHIDDRERRRGHANDKTYPIEFEIGDLVQAY
ncbi:hypothetical protein C8R43DRAFT_867082, partial [Mycena crocata]